VLVTSWTSLALATIRLHVDAGSPHRRRRRQGNPVDEPACLAALTVQEGGKEVVYDYEGAAIACSSAWAG
jgi:hypothetical protein